MAMTPEEIYKLCDRKLRNRRTMLTKAEAMVRKAMDQVGITSSPAGGGTGGGKGSRKSDKTQKAAILLAMAEKQRDDALKWMEVFKKLDAVFPERTSEGFVASLIYGNGMSQQDVCRFCGCARQTVRRKQDRYINYCAIIASRYGLIIQDDETDQSLL